MTISNSFGQADRGWGSQIGAAAASASNASTRRKIIKGRQAIERRGRFIVLGVGGLLAAIMALLGWVAFRSLSRIEEIYAHQVAAMQVRAITTQLEQVLVGQFTGVDNLDSAAPTHHGARAPPNGRLSSQLDPQTPPRLMRLDQLLQEGPRLNSQQLITALSLVRAIAQAETQARAQLIREIRGDARFEVELATVLLVLLLTVLLIGGWFIRRRVVGPLDNLRNLFLRLGYGDFRPISAEGVAPMLAPLFENYNLLVTRLEVLEAEHRSRARALEEEVQSATRTLLEQHHSLASTERLAAVGETAASMAHELRNPLSGILMSLANMRKEAADPDFSERLSLLTREVDRIVRMLNGYLDSARHEPEPLRPVNVRETVDELLKLLRYQMPLRIRLVSEIPEDLESLLPRDTFRQILLNLVSNSVEAIGESFGKVIVAGSREGDWITVSVMDDGPGFSEDFLKAGIRAFASQHESGTGLGLVMVRRAVSDFGGKLEIGNRESGGAFVSLTLPYRNV